jgi:hypothetical protein
MEQDLQALKSATGLKFYLILVKIFEQLDKIKSHGVPLQTLRKLISSSCVI